MDESIFGFNVLLLIIGVVITLIGIFIFIFKYRAGKNDIELYAFKFRTSGASLIFVVMGCILMIIAGLKASVVSKHMASNTAVNYTDQRSYEEIEEDQYGTLTEETSYNAKSNYTIVESALVENVFEINFTAGITQHRCALIVYSDGTGKMRVKYYHPETGTSLVEQDMQVENTGAGLRLAGYNPVYPGTQATFPGYSPDNLYIIKDENGNVSVTNIENQGVLTKTSVRTFQNFAQQQEFLQGFNWQLN